MNFRSEVALALLAVLDLEDLIPLILLAGIVAGIWVILAMISNQ